MPVPDPWVMDTSVFTHWDRRAGDGEILRRVAPDGEMILIPDTVNAEVELARERYSGIPAMADCEWAKLVVLGSDEGAVQLAIQADMGADTAVEHPGEAAVIAQAHGCTAILDTPGGGARLHRAVQKSCASRRRMFASTTLSPWAMLAPTVCGECSTLCASSITAP